MRWNPEFTHKSYDEALGLPTEESATVALRTQQIIAEESGVASVVDPLGGSHFVEMLTEEIYQKSLDKILEIEKMGGSMKAIEVDINREKFMRPHGLILQKLNLVKERL